MAKGNMLLGMARGSVGDVTFYRDGGIQRARSRNRQPNNPRSNKQQTQRALFANCVKFYKLTAAKFFKFAFENKKVNESDYNAFMRENLKRGVMMSKTAFYVEPYPALGNWLISRGSLSTIVNANDDNTEAPVFDLGAQYSDVPSRNITIGEISTAMVASGRYQVGDIITIVKYLSDGENIPTATPNAETDYLQTVFVYYQFLVDPNNTNPFISIFPSVPLFFITTTSNNSLAINYGYDAASAGEDWRAGYTSATVIHSRNTSTGLRVSTQELTLNPRMTQAIETAATDATYKSAVLTDWQSSGIAILQGEGMDLVDPNDYGDYIVGNHLSGNNQVQTTNESNCEVGDSFSVYIQTTKELSDEQVRALFRKSITSVQGLNVNYNATIRTTGTYTAGLYGYGCELLTVVTIPAVLTLKQQNGDINTASYN